MKDEYTKLIESVKKLDYLKRICSDPEIHKGTPCIKGTSIPVYIIVSLVADWKSYEEILKDHPSLTNEDIRAALKYATRLCELKS